jgi:ABC-type multidrug transport system ATPase subunit
MGHRTRLYEDLSGGENLRVACSLFGCDPRAVPEALERVGLSEVGGERVRTYSQGMRQRVAVARAVLRSPELLLLDEPYTGLDAEARDIVDGLIADTGRAGRTVLLATHHPVRQGLIDRTVFMEGGRLLSQAPQDADTGRGGGAS